MKALKFFAIAAAVVAAVSCATSEVKVDVELPTRAEVDSVSYLLGVNYGLMFKQNGFAENLSELDMALLKKGMEDALRLTSQRATTTLLSLSSSRSAHTR